MITDYIKRKLSDFEESQDDCDKVKVLYDLASCGRVIPRARLSEVSERYQFTKEEQSTIIDWAKAQAGVA